MNNNRRQRLSHNVFKLNGLSCHAEDVVGAIEKLNTLKCQLDDWSAQVDEIVSATEQIESEEEMAHNSIPDNLQFGNIASNIESSLSNLAEAIQSINELKDFIDSIEDAYLKFISTYSPQMLLEKLESFIEAIDEATENVKYAKE